MSFEEDIQQWVQTDNQLKLLNEKVKDLRSTRTDLTHKITDYVDTNNLSHATVKITNGKLKFLTNKQTSPITLTFLEKCLSEIVSAEDKVKHIMDYIKEKRDIKISPDIRRYYDN